MTGDCFDVYPVRADGPASIDSLGFYVLTDAMTDAAEGFTDAERTALVREESFWLSRICCYLRLSLELQPSAPTDTETAARISASGHAATPHTGDGRSSSSHGSRSLGGSEAGAAMREAQRRIVSQFRRRLRLFGGAPHALLRRLLWGFFSGSLQRPAATIRAHHATYTALSSHVPDAEMADVIERDLSRTLPTHCLFVGDASVGQAALRRVLRAMSRLDAAVGYCQGMAFVAAVLLIHAPEEEAFWILAHLCLSPSFRMREMYMPGFPLLQRHLDVLRRLLERWLPTLHRHFEEKGMDVAFFASQWFMTLYTYQFPIEFTCRLWDFFLVEGWRVMFQAAMAMLQWEQEELLALDMEEMLLCLKECHEGRSNEELLRRTLNVPLTDAELSGLMSTS